MNNRDPIISPWIRFECKNFQGMQKMPKSEKDSEIASKYWNDLKSVAC